jgi:hypothetical protein
MLAIERDRHHWYRGARTRVAMLSGIHFTCGLITNIYHIFYTIFGCVWLFVLLSSRIFRIFFTMR